MAEITALRKHPCPECGGDAEWNPAKQALACPYCGHVLPWSPGEAREGELIKEHDLISALRNTSREERGWGEAKSTVKCQSCHAIMVFDASRLAQRCEFCASPAIVPHEEARDAITPESLLPFQLSQAQVREALRKWYGSHWLAPSKLKQAALTDTLHGIYLPYWTFDAHVHADWEADAGYYYYVTETFRDANGQTQTRQVQKVRWVPAAGSLEHFFDDDLVPGTTGVPLASLRKVEPFPTTELKSYDPAFVRGWVVERYQVDLRQAADLNMAQMEAVVRSLCSRQVPGDTQRNLRVASQYRGRTFKHILVPVWLATYTYGRTNYQVVVNGHSGRIAGSFPISWVKVFFYIILPIIVFLILVVLVQGK